MLFSLNEGQKQINTPKINKNFDTTLNPSIALKVQIKALEVMMECLENTESNIKSLKSLNDAEKNQVEIQIMNDLEKYKSIANEFTMAFSPDNNHALKNELLEFADKFAALEDLSQVVYISFDLKYLNQSKEILEPIILAFKNTFEDNKKDEDLWVK